MLLAMYENARMSPRPGLIAACPACGGTVIAKCGQERLHHWAHKGRRVCDPWWENETHWHRRWKSYFPEDQQEIIRIAPDGDKHIADVHMPAGLTIEFQHSSLRPEERAARETFHQNLIWVVDGQRLVNDRPRFEAGAAQLHAIKGNRIFLHPQPEKLLPSSWLRAQAPVYFDFGVHDDPAPSLWCLLPQRLGRHALIIRMTRYEFLLAAREDPALLLARDLPAMIAHALPRGQQQPVRLTFPAVQMASRAWRPPRLRQRF
jgi:hypothetical protein